jgi:ACR3 family arsenite efflux pump ArsB
LLPRFAPVSIGAILATLVLIFAFQADNILGKPFHVLLIAIPILAQVYFQLIAHLRTDAPVSGPACCGRAWRVDWRE